MPSPAAHWLRTVESVAPLLALSIQESAGAYRSAFIQDPRIQLEPMHGDDYTPRCFSKLLLNRIDACYQPDHYPLVFEANKNQYDSRIRVITLPEPPIGLYSVFSKQSAGIYLQSYETALDEVAREITYEDLFKAFIDKKRPRIMRSLFRPDAACSGAGRFSGSRGYTVSFSDRNR